MKRLFHSLLFCLSFLVVSTAHAYTDTLDAMLSDHVKPVVTKEITYNGVDYSAWRADPRHAKLFNAITSIDPSTLKTKAEKLAYWINAYNILTIDLITRERERESIKNLGGLLTTPWQKHKWFITGTEYTLDHIEHKIVRKLGEPRIHFALNCAAKSCPDLRMEAYKADQIEEQLDDQVQRTFKNKTKGLTFVDGSNAVRVTKVMDWFSEDFNGGALRSWLQPYFPKEIDEKTDVVFFDYDWSLNKQ